MKRVIYLAFIAVLFLIGCSEGDPELKVSTNDLDFGTIETQRNFTIENSGSEKGIFKSGVKDLNYEMITSDEWISINPVSGKVKKGDEEIVSVIVDKSTLESGINNGNIQISSNGGNETIDISVENQIINVISPTANDEIRIGETTIISWEISLNLSDQVNIYLLKNNTIVDTLILDYNYTQNRDDLLNGEFNWVPDLYINDDSDYKIRINDSSNSNVYGESNQFSIISSLNFLFPTIGSELQIGEETTIEWQASSSLSGSVDIYLLLNGSIIDTIATDYNYVRGTMNFNKQRIISKKSKSNNRDIVEGIFNWTIDYDLISSDSYFIKIIDSNFNSIETISGEFSITGPIMILSPISGDVLTIGENTTISWSTTDLVSDSVDIRLYLDGEFLENIEINYTSRRKNRNQHDYTWTPWFSLFEDNNYSIKINDSNNQLIATQSGYFEIQDFYQGGGALTAINFLNVQPAHLIPSKVQFNFSLRDQDNHAVLINPSDVDWQDINIWENGEEIDYSESYPFFSTSNDFPMELMLVLDFSASMSNNSQAIADMINGAQELMNTMGETHKIGVIEFHRPENEQQIIKPFTTDKQDAMNSIIDFANSPYYADFSRCWDAVYLGLEQFSTQNTNGVRTLLFLSDGFDNSSNHSPDQLISLANTKNVQVYNIGVGNVSSDNLLTLQNISDQTGGTYVPALNIENLIESFQIIIRDLYGQYKISYITPKDPADGQFQVSIKINYNGVESEVMSEYVNPNDIFGETSKGIISFSTSTIENGNTEVFMNAQHIPRYINKFYFYLNTSANFSIELPSPLQGGLCSDWNINDEGNGWYKMSSPDTLNSAYDLEYGDDGVLSKIIFENISGSGLTIPFYLDNSIYSLGQSFYGGNVDEIDSQGNWNTTIYIENPTIIIYPLNNEENVSIHPTLNWTPYREDYTYDIRMGTEYDNLDFITTGLIEPSYTIVNYLDFYTEYFWQIVFHIDNDVYYNEVNSFTTYPFELTNPSPANNNINTSISPILQWDFSNIDQLNVIYDISFGTNSDSLELLSYHQTETNFSFEEFLNFDTTYFWQVEMHYNQYSAVSPIWSFNTYSLDVSPLSPPNESNSVSINPILEWFAYNPNNLIYTYDVFWGENPDSLSLIAEQIIDSNLQIEDNLQYETEYFWNVKLNYDSLEVISPTWSFSTGTIQFFSPFPSDNELSIPLTTSFSWENDIQNPENVFYNVFLDTIPALSNQVAYNITEPSFEPSEILEFATHYYWKIIMVIDGTEVISPTWSFTTVTESSGDIPTDYIAYYPFTNGSLDDFSGNGNNGTAYGDAQPTSDRFDNNNNAYIFDGNSDYIKLSDTNLTGCFTISVWHRVNTTSDNYQGILTKKDTSINTNKHYGLLLHQDDVWGQVSNGNQDYLWIEANNQAINEWQHIIFINDENSSKIYIDGELVISDSNNIMQIGNVAFWKIGVDGDYNNFYDGKIDDIRLYNRALELLEIEALYHEGGWDE